MPSNETTQLASAFNLVRIYPQGWQSASFRNDEGLDIYYTIAKPFGPKKGTVIFTPGYGDSINFHYDTIGKWQRRGYDVYSMDWIGQGLSDREPKDHVQDPNDRLMTRHVSDLTKFVSEIVPKDASRPLILVSHSMGGHINMKFLKEHPGLVDGAILGAPLIDLNTSILPRGAFKGLVRAATAVGLGDNSLPNWRDLLNRFRATSDNIQSLSGQPEKLSLSQDASERIRQFLKPVQIDLPTWGWIKRIYPSLDDMHKKDYFEGIETPVLFIAAGRDELVSNDAIHFAAKNLAKGKVLDLPTATHGVWNESEKNKTAMWDEIDTFVKTNIQPLHHDRPVNDPSRPALPPSIPQWRRYDPANGPGQQPLAPGFGEPAYGLS